MKIVNKCKGCLTNWTGHQQGTVFELQKEEKWRKKWIKFINRKYINAKSMKYAVICEKHFEEKYSNINTNRSCLISSLIPVPTLFSESQQKLLISILPAIVKTRNPPAKRNIQEDEAGKLFVPRQH